MTLIGTPARKPCPSCGGDMFSDAIYCRECKNWLPGHEPPLPKKDRVTMYVSIISAVTGLTGVLIAGYDKFSASIITALKADLPSLLVVASPTKTIFAPGEYPDLEVTFFNDGRSAALVGTSLTCLLDDLATSPSTEPSLAYFQASAPVITRSKETEKQIFAFNNNSPIVYSSAEAAASYWTIEGRIAQKYTCRYFYSDKYNNRTVGIIEGLDILEIFHL